ncbi:MAG TPA: 2-amino-4-hydroxy-6-hydroxymethyldihydropteridine diphosphokinase [Cyclobacteriaceae bacterium]
MTHKVMDGIYLLLGGNLGDRWNNLVKAQYLLKKEAINIISSSSIYESASWGIQNQPDFLNLSVKISTELQPIRLLEKCLMIENIMGRERIVKWGSRLIDIDILYYYNEIISTDDLKVPHPGIPDRKFTITPLAELAPNEVHPLLNKNQQTLLEVCKDNLNVRIYKNKA